jgi:alpha,alpha-trehalase
MAAHLNLSFEPDRVAVALRYIDGYWPQLLRHQVDDVESLIGLPRPYLVPTPRDENGKFDEQYYWDSYFMGQGLVGTRYEPLYEDMIENLLYLYQHFGIIPNASRTYMTSRSQPPVLTSMIMQVYERKRDKKWLARAIGVAKEEYRNVWMGTTAPNWRQVFAGLSRYYDINSLHDLAECESGWDMTTRFGRQALSYLPVDLNALLWRYERDFAAAALILGDAGEANEWQKAAVKRRNAMMRYLWDDEQGFWFDYNFMTGQRGKVWSMAAFYPMWVGMMSPSQVQRMLRHLPKFEHDGGLTTTARNPVVASPVPVQWAYPNGWAPLQLIATEALERYGYHLEAERVARKWLKTNLLMFEHNGLFYEKYNVVSPGQAAVDGLYPMQVGFGWTNAVFTKLALRYLKSDELPTRFQRLKSPSKLKTLLLKQRKLRPVQQGRKRLVKA